jgi:hypothetical protein
MGFVIFPFLISFDFSTFLTCPDLFTMANMDVEVTVVTHLNLTHHIGVYVDYIVLGARLEVLRNFFVRVGIHEFTPFPPKKTRAGSTSTLLFLPLLVFTFYHDACSPEQLAASFDGL